MAHSRNRFANIAHPGPLVFGRIITRPRAQVSAVGNAPPNDHFALRPIRVGMFAIGWRTLGDHRSPNVGDRVITPAGAENVAAIGAAPDNHLTTSPNCTVIKSRRGRTYGINGRPGVVSRIITPTGLRGLSIKTE